MGGPVCRRELWPRPGSDRHVVAVGVEVGDGEVTSEAVRADQKRLASLRVIDPGKLADRHHVHRRTVRQALASAMPPQRKAYRPRPRPAIGPYAAIIDEWLLADRDVPRKQRHTARRVWQRLAAEHGATVAEVTVLRYVARRRGKLVLDKTEVMVPQAHAPGAEAEVDFGEFHAVIAGVVLKLWMFVMRLSCSGRAFHVAFATQAQEAFLEGHVLAFEYFGAVPARVRASTTSSPPWCGCCAAGTGPSPSGSSCCAPITGTTRSSARRERKAPTRRAGSKARSAGSAAATWSPSPRSRRWRR